MRETITYIRHSLQEIYPYGELQAFIRIIMESVCGLTTCQLLVGKDRELSEKERSKIEEIVEGLRQQQPIQYLLGEALFHGLTLKVTPAVLIPRPETAELVDLILQDWPSGSSPRLLDVGTGSGCIAIALAKALPKAQIEAMDVSPEALEVAQENARMQEVEIQFRQTDILKIATEAISPVGIVGNVGIDGIVSNPPYILQKESAQMERNVLAYEPHLALFVPDDDPLLFYRAIADYARTALRPGGKLYFEINPLCAEALVEMLQAKQFKAIEIMCDFYGKSRFILAKI
ncbi:MAG: peptide chain release factor N(5)-glutamine methyltransferase [Parabacteroides sp.]